MTLIGFLVTAAVVATLLVLLSLLERDPGRARTRAETTAARSRRPAATDAHRRGSDLAS